MNSIKARITGIGVLGMKIPVSGTVELFDFEMEYVQNTLSKGQGYGVWTTIILEGVEKNIHLKLTKENPYEEGDQTLILEGCMVGAIGGFLYIDFEN